jgi:hypothetical protein
MDKTHKRNEVVKSNLPKKGDELLSRKERSIDVHMDILDAGELLPLPSCYPPSAECGYFDPVSQEFWGYYVEED